MELVDKKELAHQMVESLPEIRRSLGISCGDIEKMTGIGEKRVIAIEEGRQKMRWREFLSILFVLWSDVEGAVLMEEKGLFPQELKQAFSMNRNEH